jgi:hypothetical protein
LVAATKPIPDARAFSIAMSIARVAVIAPSARSPSRSAEAGASLAIRRFGRRFAPPSRSRATR